MAYATVLRRCRKAAGLTQEELAGEAGVSVRYVSVLEGSKHQPSLGTMSDLARALGVSLATMIADAEALTQSNPQDGA